ncbi:uncharacterized protein RJT20DRAFT_126054 [Scheffersomyces xylosifermentans]|uniref:uncharacterized protein n=1 Tax=Scheffersomyces xylosifermentans TaxID=1304137 RepID=UPI00315D14F0
MSRISRLDDDVANGWKQSYISYAAIGSRTIPPEDLDMTNGHEKTPIEDHNEDPDALDVVLRVSEEIPQLSKLIADSSNSDDLERELRDAVMKFYWNGYYSGFASASADQKETE